MAYQAPIVAQKSGNRRRPPRPLWVAVGLYLTMSLSYSAGYGQAMEVMATTSAGAARLLSQGDYSEIAGMSTVLSPLIRIGINDAVRFKDKNLLFGVFCPFWLQTQDITVARQNAGLVQMGKEPVAPGVMGGTGVINLSKLDHETRAMINDGQISAQMLRDEAGETVINEAVLDRLRRDPETAKKVERKIEQNPGILKKYGIDQQTYQKFKRQL